MTQQTHTTAPAIPEQATPETKPSGGTEPEHGARIITVLEAAWSVIRQQHPDVPRVVMITGSKQQHGGARLGHYGHDLWSVREQGRAPELFIAGELFAEGGRAVLLVLLHEASHGVAKVRGDKDTSSAGRYHNRKFVKIAEELGLKGPARPVPVHGWSFCTLPDTTAAAYAAVVDAIDAAHLPYLGAPGSTPLPGDEDEPGTDEQDDTGKSKKKGGRAGRRFAIECGCDEPRRIQITPKAYEAGPLLCGLCTKPFAPIPENDEE
jgi:hypothetical protein